ncbi:helix-turn-helix domain-containing protein [Micromonospora sp. NPDC093277]|uniref:helix-turn-helix domain-containing protein n=1 Tax=Micromonospora sp. NPDC093277 TaxID=3364291 RepID=UPI0037FF2691
MKTGMMKSSVDASFSIFLKTSRIRLGLTQAELAIRSMVSIRSIRNLESGYAKYPRKQTVDLLADALQLDNQARADFVSAARPHEHAFISPRLSAIPHDPDPLIGRDTTVDLATTLLADRQSRWISLGGIAGIGKTRVAQSIAQRVHEATRCPVLWTSAASRQELDRVDACGSRKSSKSELCVAIGQSLRSGEDPSLRLAALLGDRHVLVVIDDLASSLILQESLTRFLGSCRNASLLTCTRAPSRYPTAHQIPLVPLAVPETPEDMRADRAAGFPAVALLKAHLRRIRPDAPVSAVQIMAMAHVSRALDGIPLALKAASSWLPLYTSDELLELIRQTPTLVLEPVTEDGSASAAGLLTALSAAVEGLPPEHAAILRVLADMPASWSVGVAAQTVRVSLPEAAKAVNGFLQFGLVRPAELNGGEFGRFQVLNLVRHLLREPVLPVGTSRWAA